MTRVGDRVDPDSLVGQRWFANPRRAVTAASVEELFSLPGGGQLAIVRVEAGPRETSRYSMPLEPGPDTWRGLAALAASGARVSGDAGWSIEGVAPPGRHAAPGRPAVVAVSPLGVDQSNTSWIVGDRLVKLYRRLAAGRNPEAELSVALAADPAAPVPRFHGAIRVAPPRRAGLAPRLDVAVVQGFVAGATDEFERSADALAAWLAAGAPPARGQELAAELGSVGRTVVALHRSLGGLRGRGLTPRPAGPVDVVRWRRAANRAVRDAVAAMRAVDPTLAAEIEAARPRLEGSLLPLADARPPGPLSRIHGDLHIGQVIRDGDRVLVADLEGEPTRSFAARRRVDMPLRDVASMLRSIDHVARSGARRASRRRRVSSERRAALDRWIDDARSAFLAGHGGPVDVPLLHALEVEKELYEFTYAARYLPDWRYAPAGGLRWLLERGPA